MCSIILTKINKDLTSIVREYLSLNQYKPDIFQLKENYDDLRYNQFLTKCHFLQMKRRFPQIREGYEGKNKYIFFYYFY